MNEAKGFTIEISSSFNDWWRYNLAVMCGCFDASGVRTGFASTEDRVAEIGGDTQKKPAGYDKHRIVRMTTPECHNIILYIYIIPHTLPSVREVEECKPFGIEIKVSYAGKRISSKNVDINQWSGASLEMKINKD